MKFIAKMLTGAACIAFLLLYGTVGSMDLNRVEFGAGVLRMALELTAVVVAGAGAALAWMTAEAREKRTRK